MISPGGIATAEEGDKEMSDELKLCPNCKSPQIVTVRHDTDWGSGHDIEMVNPETHYDQGGISFGDINLLSCLVCGYTWQKYFDPNPIPSLLARAENAEKALNDAGDVIASIVACCTYGSEEQAKAGAYGLSHEAFTRIDTFIRKYGDLLQAIDPKKGGE